MIPVTPQPEPADFDRKVRQPGISWLQQNGININQPLPTGTKIKECWRDCLDDLHDSYDGVCAYLGVYIELVAGSHTVDHFLGKKARPDLAYEWSNYRYCCSSMNTNKGEANDVLDPFTIYANSFELTLYTGEIRPAAPRLTPEWQAADATIRRLRLDNDKCCTLRRRYFEDYRDGHISRGYLERRAPFVFQEALRQGRL